MQLCVPKSTTEQSQTTEAAERMPYNEINGVYTFDDAGGPVLGEDNKGNPNSKISADAKAALSEAKVSYKALIYSDDPKPGQDRRTQGRRR